MKRFGIAAACLALALLTFFQFPGHTWLQQDTQIYVPILERLENPDALRNDILAATPHVAYTLYDETALGLRRATGLDFARVVAAVQIVARAFGIWGLYLMALCVVPGDARRRALLALAVAAICSLGAAVAGPTVLTVEYEPTPRAFALPLAVCAIGLTAHRRFLAAGVAAAAAFLFHPPTALPVWALFVLAVAWPGKPGAIVHRLTGVAPLAASVVVLMLCARRQEGASEAQAFFTRLPGWLEQLQRFRAPYNWIGLWPAGVIAHYGILAAVFAAAYARVRREIPAELRIFLLGLPLAGLLSMPASWLLLDRWKWALLPQYQPMRCLLFVTLFAQFAAASAGARAAVKERFLEAGVWIAAAFLVTVQPLWTVAWNLRAAAVAVGLGALGAACAKLETRGAPALLFLALLAFFAIPVAGGVENYPRLRTPELEQLAAWARANTPPEAVFLFADTGRGGEPGVFRAEAERAVYVDWKGGGQVNYLPGFAKEWDSRWRATLASRFRPSAMRGYATLGVQYAVLQRANRLPVPPLFENARYLVYAVR